MKQSSVPAGSKRKPRQNSHTGPPRKKGKLAQIQHHHVPRSEIELDDLSVHDVQYIHENAALAQLIANTDINALTRKTQKSKQEKYPRRPPQPSQERTDEYAELIVEESSSSSDDGSENDDIQQYLDEGSEDELAVHAGGELDANIYTSHELSCTDVDEHQPETKWNAMLASMNQCNVDSIPSDIESSEDDAPLDRDFNDSVIEKLNQPGGLSRNKLQQALPEEEEMYEVQPRSVAPRRLDRLPIKLSDGRLVRVQEDQERKVQNPEPEPLQPPNQQQRPAKARHEALLIDETNTVQSLEIIADICDQVMNMPDQKITKLKNIVDYIETRSSSSHMIQAVAIASIGQVFLNVIPGYPITQLTDEQKKERITKEVRKLRAYEQTLLVLYQRYLCVLDKVIKARVTSGMRKAGGVVEQDPGYVAVMMLSKILVAHPDFNFHLNIVNVLVKRLARVEFRSMILDTFRRVFVRDESGKLSGIVVQLVSKYIKQVKFKVPAGVVEVFESLRLKQELGLQDLTVAPVKNPVRGAAKPAGYVNKKRRKLNKHARAVNEELKQAEAVVDVADRKKNHRVTLDHVFLTYFRILKSSEQASSNLIIAVLKGLSSYAHLISIEYLASLMTHFKTILRSAAHVCDEAKLQIVVAATKIMSGLGTVLSFDISELHQFTYMMLGRLTVGRPSRGTMHCVLETIDVSVLRACGTQQKKIRDLVRGMVYRLLTLASTADDPGLVMAILAIASALFCKYESAVVGLVSVPSDQCSALALGVADHHEQLAYQVSSLVLHWHPEVRAAARALLRSMDAARSGNGAAHTRIMAWQQCVEQWSWVRNGVEWRYVPGFEAVQSMAARRNSCTKMKGKCNRSQGDQAQG